MNKITWIIFSLIILLISIKIDFINSFQSIKSILVPIYSILSSVFSENNKYADIFIYSVASSIVGTFIAQLYNVFNFITGTLFLGWIQIDNNQDNDEVYEWVSYFLNKQMEEQRIFSLTMLVETASSLNKIWFDPDKNTEFCQTRFVPGKSWSILKIKDKYDFILVCSDIGQSTNTYYRSHTPKTIFLYKFCFPQNRNKIWIDFIAKVKSFYEKDITKYQRIYKSERWGYWRGPLLVNSLKLNEGVFVQSKEMQNVINQIEIFLKPETKKLYQKKGFPYSRKILAYGPPGTGKSNLIIRIAGHYNLPMYYLNCQGLSDADLIELFDEVQRGIIIIEEIDKCVCEITNHTKKEKKDVLKSGDDFEGGHRDENGTPSLVAWHKVLDKVMGRQVIVYMTTNNIDKLEKLNNGSLIRTERVDQKILFDYIDNTNFINRLISKYLDTYNISNDTYTEYIDLIDVPTYIKLTCSDIINIFKEYKSEDAILEKIKNMLLLDNHNNSNTKNTFNKKMFNTIIKNMCKKYNIELSNKYIEQLLELLEKNSVENLDDFIAILNNSSYKDKLLDNYKLPFIDSLKFKQICEKEFDPYDECLDSDEHSYLIKENHYESLEFSGGDINASHIIKDLKEKCLEENYKIDDKCFDFIKNSLEKHKIVELDDFKLLVNSDKLQECIFEKDDDSKNKKNKISTIDKIKIDKILEKYYTSKEIEDEVVV